MAWTTPKTWTVGEVLTAANMNIHVRDNQNYLYSGRPFARWTETSSTSIASATWGDLGNFVFSFDNAAMVNAGYIQIPTGHDGAYVFQATVGFAAGNNGTQRSVGFRKNGATGSAADDFVIEAPGSFSTGNGPRLEHVAIYDSLVAGDKIYIAALHDIGSASSVSLKRAAAFALQG